jgi:hypothetical protein
MRPASRLALYAALWVAGAALCVASAAGLGLAARVLWLAFLWGWERL